MARNRSKLLTYVAVAFLSGVIFTAAAFAASVNVKGNRVCNRPCDGSCPEE
ncbi:MAG: hypothetical protein SCH66_04485 [Methanolobus sp.]|nr:hypothetical protein [Methanolobus sp.]